eukprot:m.55106 g.55106  ORF g.55106 m.55106 type:complete len:75 (+) comp13650_c1_seq8:1326-1550(+)
MLACHACNSSAMDSPYPTLAQLTYSFCLQWHADLNDKVMLANGDPVPAILLANKVCCNCAPTSVSNSRFLTSCQ